MKKLIVLIIMCIFVLSGLPACDAQAKVIQVIVNDAGTAIKLDGKALNFSIGPVVKDGRMMVPFRDFAEQLGYQVQWDPQQKKVTIIGETITGEKQVVLWVGDNHAIMMESGKETDVILDVSPTIIQGRTMVPLRFVGEAMDCEVKYERTVAENVSDSKPLARGSLLQAPYTVSNTFNNITFQAGTPAELVEIAKVVDVDDQAVSKECIVEQDWLYQIEAYPDEKYFHIPIRHLDKENIKQDTKKILKVFFPTEYEKAYSIVIEAWQAGCNDNYTYSKDRVFDGRTFHCDRAPGVTSIDIGA